MTKVLKKKPNESLLKTKSETHLTEREEILEEEIVVDLPPIKRYTLKGRIKSIRDGELNPETESEMYLTDDEEILEEEIVVDLPPIKRYTVKGRIKSVRDGKLRIPKPEELP